MAFVPISNWFSDVSRARAGHTAYEQGTHALSYETLEQSSNEIARVLLSDESWAPQSVVAILVSTPVEALIAILGTLKAGGAFAPMDVLAPPTRLAQMLEDASPAYLVSDADHHARAADVLLQLTTTPKQIVLKDLGTLAHQKPFADRYAAVRHAPDDLAYLYFTSGSSGRPKPIAGRLKAIDHFVRWEIDTFGVDGHSRVSQLASVAFDAYLRDVFVPLCAGGTICAPADRGIVWRPAEFADWIDSSSLTHLHCVPSMFRSLLEAPLNSHRFGTLTHVFLAGESLLPSDVDRWMTTFGTRVRLVNFYGPSETTLIKLFHIVNEADRQSRAVPVGKAIPGAAALIVDESQSPCAPGMVGEIWIRTPFMAHGYHKRPDLTEKAFITNPFTKDANDIVYRTGDLGRLRDDGNLEVLGRTDTQVKVKGVRIELTEIEDVLRRCNAIRDAVVTVDSEAIPPVLRGHLILREGGSLEIVRRHLAEWLPIYMVPTDLVVCDAFPRTTTGKIDRKRLASTPRRPPQQETNDAPAPTSLAWEIGEIWREVLKVPRVGLEDNFFHIGGHSLTVVQVISRLRQRMALDLSMADLFATQTLRSFALRVQQVLDEERDRESNPTAADSVVS
jgi:amino acid adenylation domain-containing protein